MTTSLNFARFNGWTPPTGHRFAERTRANPTQLTLTASDVYARNGQKRTRRAYLACFQQLNLEKRPFFSKTCVSRSEMGVSYRRFQNSVVGRCQSSVLSRQSLDLPWDRCHREIVPASSGGPGADASKSMGTKEAGMCFRISNIPGKTFLDCRGDRSWPVWLYVQHRFRSSRTAVGGDGGSV